MKYFIAFPNLRIRRRKNSLFFKTEAGAKVAEIIQSVIYTAARYDPSDVFNYLVAILENQVLVKKSPEKWMPWNYRAILSEIAVTKDQLSTVNS